MSRSQSIRSCIKQRLRTGAQSNPFRSTFYDLITATSLRHGHYRYIRGGRIESEFLALPPGIGPIKNARRDHTRTLAYNSFQACILRIFCVAVAAFYIPACAGVLVSCAPLSAKWCLTDSNLSSSSDNLPAGRPTHCGWSVYVKRSIGLTYD
jgi:hypothetical protein